MRRFRGRRALFSGAAVAVTATMVLSLGLGAVASASKANHKSPAASGGVATFAEGPSAAPNFIFPYVNFTYCSVANISQFQYLMYRPLYSFGASGSPTFSNSESIGNLPTFSGGNKTLTLTLKKWYWSNGEQVTAQDVVFWLNIEKVEGVNYCGYVPGTLPDDISSITTPNSTTLTIKLTGSVNPTWYLQNELAEITPLPMAWDVTKAGQKAGSQACGTASFKSVTTRKSASGAVAVSAAAKSCVAVYDHLETESGFNPVNPKQTINAAATYATNPLWAVVDGPWKLTAFTSTGEATFKPNAKYSGPVKPKLAEFVELPFTSDTAEYNALLGGKVDDGYLPSQDITSNAKSATVAGKNAARLSGKFNLVAAPTWQITYFPYNFNSSDNGGEAGKLMKQAYFRQAFQEEIDQPAIIKKIFKGYGYPTYGPVPFLPKNPFSTSYEEKNPFTYNPSKAVATLKAHGWTINVNGTDVCATASKCGVPAGTKASLNLIYASGITALDEEMAVEISAWKTAGINVTASQASFDTTIGDAVPCPSASTPQADCTWDLVNWGGGWIFSPDFYPSGEDLFQTGASANVGNYSSSYTDSLIKATDFTSASLAKYEDYLTEAPPVVYEPTAETAGEVLKTLQGTTPVNPIAYIYPENWSFK